MAGCAAAQVAKACAPHSVLLTDNQPDAIDNATHNVEANGLAPDGTPAVAVEHLDWASAASLAGAADDGAPPALSRRLLDTDTILAADVTYDPAACKILAACIRALLSLRGRDLTTRCAPVAYLAAQVRNPATWDAFVSEFASFERTAPSADLPTAQLHIDEVPMHGHQWVEGPREGQLRIVRIGTWSSLRKV